MVKILVVDDSATMRKIIEMTFAGEDAEVVVVDTGGAAITSAAHFKPDVVFADTSMGSPDGYDVCRAIKSNPDLSSTAVILLASQHNPYDAERGRAASADDYVAKPFDTQIVIDKVTQALSKPRAAAQVPAPPKPPATPSRQPGRSPKRTVAFGRPPGAPPAPMSQAPVAAAPPAAPANVSQPPRVSSPRPPSIPPAPPRAVPSPPAAAASVSSAGRASVPAAAAAAANGAMADKLDGLGLSEDQLQGVLRLSREVIEQVVWEVVPDLAETIIREEIKRLTQG